MGVLVADGHPFARREWVSVGQLCGESLLLADDARAPELNEFITEMCRSAGFTPRVHPGRVDSVRAAAAVVSDGCCIACVPRSCGRAASGTTWVPLFKPALGYPWSLLWRADNSSTQVRALRECAQAIARTLNWVCCDSCLEGCEGEAISSCDHVS
jgi:DNA-binding transcriptional LysR family regulator